jgi:hypothetical protein
LRQLLEQQHAAVHARERQPGDLREHGTGDLDDRRACDDRRRDLAE